MLGSKVKTSIVVDKELWEKFKEKVISSYGPRCLSKAVEEAIEEELVELIVVREIDASLSKEKIFTTATPVKPRVKTKAEEVVREIRGSRV